VHTPKFTNNYASGIESGALVYTQPRHVVDIITKPFINSTQGLSMAVDGSIVPTVTESVWSNGVGYTATALSGTWDFASTFTATGWPPTGTLSINATATVNNNEAELDKGSDLSLSSYDFIRGSIYITSWPTSGTKQVLVELRDSSDAVVGVTADIGAYIDTTTFNTDQVFTIPLADLSAEGATIRKIVIRTVDIGGGQAPNYYLAEIKFQDGGTGYKYEITPGSDKTLFINRISIQMERAYNVTTSNQHAIGMTGLLGSGTLPNGIRAGISENGIIAAESTATFKDLRNWITFPQVQGEKISSFGDGTNTTLRFQIDYTEVGGLRLRPSLQEAFFYIIQDDLSSFDFFQIWADCHEIVEE